MPGGSDQIRFVAESSLGRLAKWLRLLGFDTIFCPGKPDDRLHALAGEGRILLTRAKRIASQNPGGRIIFITPNDPRDQLCQVVSILKLDSIGELPAFSLCLACNTSLDIIEKKDVMGRVPDYTFRIHDTFRECPECRRIFWSGSHVKRSLETLSELFGNCLEI